MKTTTALYVRTLSGCRSSVWQIEVRHHAVYLFRENHRMGGWHLSFHSDGRNHMKLSSNKKYQSNRPTIKWFTGRVERMADQRYVIGLVLAIDLGSIFAEAEPIGCTPIDAPDSGLMELCFLFSNAGNRPVTAEPGTRIVLDTHMQGAKRFHLIARHSESIEPDLMIDNPPEYRFTNGTERLRNNIRLGLGPNINDGVAYLLERGGHAI